MSVLDTDNKEASAPLQRDGAFEVEKVDVINFRNISKSFKLADGSIFELYKDFNLDIKDFHGEGQFISILGQSGCGKSQLLKMLSGLNEPDSGTVHIYGEKITRKNQVPMVFQQYSSLPWLTVLDNIALPLKMRGVAKAEREEQALKMIEVVGLQGQETKWAQYPELSGGQLQRVAIARSLIASPQILLMDEPFGALDIATRSSMQHTLLDIFNHSRVDATVIFVTHDIREAVRLSNRIYILKAKPCTVNSIVDINYSGDRIQDFPNTPEFNKYVSEIEKIMLEIND